MSFNKTLMHFLSIVRNAFDRFQKNRKLKLLANIVIISGAVIFIGIYTLRQWSELQNTRFQFEFKNIVYAFLVYGFNIILFILAWHNIIQIFQNKQSLPKNALIYAITLIARILPTPAWYLLGRVYYYRESMPKRVALTATLSETFLHAWIGFLFYAILSVKLNDPITWIYVIFGLIATIALAFIVRRYLQSKQILLSDQKYINHGFWVILFFSITWITSAIFFNLLIRSLTNEVTIPFIELWKIWIISSVISYISSYTLGGLGILRELSLIFLLSTYFPSPFCIAIAVLSRLSTTISNIIWSGLIILVSRLFISREFSEELWSFRKRS